MKNNSVITKYRMMTIIFVIVSLICTYLTVPAFEEGSETGAAAAGSRLQVSEAFTVDNVGYAPAVFADERQLAEVQQIHLPFPDVTEEKIEWDFPVF